MKRLFFIFSFLVMFLYCHAELFIGVVVPEQQGRVDTPAFKMLQTRLQQLMTSVGCSSMQRSGLIVYPVVNTLNEELVEGGMKNLYITEFEISLFIYHVDTKTHFGSYSYVVKGSGISYSAASKSAFSKLKTTDVAFSQFMDSIKKDIYTFFENYREDLIAKAKTYSQMQQYEEALALLYSYPGGIAGSDQVNTVMIEIFKLYQAANCAQIIQQSQSYIAQRDYESALFMLSSIDTMSPCATESKKLIKETEKKINARITEARQQEKLELDRLERRERMTVNAIKDIVIAYCNKSQPKITYQNIFR